MSYFDRLRRDGRIFGYVSSTRTIRSSILSMNEGYITLVDFPHPVWFSYFKNIPRNKLMWFVLAEYEGKWRLVDYLEEEIDKPCGKQPQWIGL